MAGYGEECTVASSVFALSVILCCCCLLTFMGSVTVLGGRTFRVVPTVLIITLLSVVISVVVVTMFDNSLKSAVCVAS